MLTITFTVCINSQNNRNSLFCRDPSVRLARLSRFNFRRYHSDLFRCYWVFMRPGRTKRVSNSHSSRCSCNRSQNDRRFKMPRPERMIASRSARVFARFRFMPDATEIEDLRHFWQIKSQSREDPKPPPGELPRPFLALHARLKGNKEFA